MSALYHQFPAFTVDGLAIGALYALIAFGFTIVYRILRLFNFVHGGVYMVGTFVTLFVARGLHVGSAHGLAVVGDIVLMALASMAVGAVLSVALEGLIYRPIRVGRGGGLPALVAGLGVLTAIQEAMGLWQGRDQIAVPQALGNKAVFSVFGTGVYQRQLLLFVVAVVVIVAIDRYVNLSRVGRALRAVGQDARTASLMGINVERVVILSFVLAGACAGLAGTLGDLYFSNTSYSSGFSLGITGLTAALLGGMGSFSGALVGGLALGLAESYGGAIFGAQWQSTLAFVVLIILLMVRPTGLVGERLATVRA